MPMPIKPLRAARLARAFPRPVTGSNYLNLPTEKSPRGPGTVEAAQAAKTRQAMSYLLSAERPAVIDADGLNCIAQKAALLSSLTERERVLTPHPGELGRLLGILTSAVQASRTEVVGRVAQNFGSVTLLKGARTLVASPEGRLYYNREGSVSLATAGSGDVLTGVIAALLAALPRFVALGYRVLLGASRKRFIAAIDPLAVEAGAEAAHAKRRRRPAAGALAQHSGKAVVEMHGPVTMADTAHARGGLPSLSPVYGAS